MDRKPTDRMVSFFCSLDTCIWPGSKAAEIRALALVFRQIEVRIAPVRSVVGFASDAGPKIAAAQKRGKYAGGVEHGRCEKAMVGLPRCWHCVLGPLYWPSVGARSVAEPLGTSGSWSHIRSHAAGADLGTTGPPDAIKRVLLWFWGRLFVFGNVQFCFVLLRRKGELECPRLLLSCMGHAIPLPIPARFQRERRRLWRRAIAVEVTLLEFLRCGQPSINSGLVDGHCSRFAARAETPTLPHKTREGLGNLPCSHFLNSRNDGPNSAGPALTSQNGLPLTAHRPPE